MYCYRVPTAEVPEAWPHVAPLLQRALDQTYGEYDLDDIFALVLEEAQQLHVIGDLQHGIVAAATTEIVQYPQRRAVRIHLLGGELLNGWRAAFDRYMEQGARERGADQIEFIGRPGWERVFRGTDKRATRMTIIKEVAQS